MYSTQNYFKETTIKILDDYLQVEDSNSMRFFPIGEVTLNSILGMISGSVRFVNPNGESVTINI
jgi:hypothetical protein